VQSAIDAAARQAQNSNPAAKVTWIIPDHLQSAFSHILNGKVLCDASADDEVWSEIRRQAEAIKSGAPNSEVYLVTWNQFVFQYLRLFTRRQCGQQFLKVAQVRHLHFIVAEGNGRCQL